LKKIFFKWISIMTKCWITNTDTRKALSDSYKTLLKTLEEVNGCVKSIYIVEN
jgi:hypothetical protein